MMIVGTEKMRKLCADSWECPQKVIIIVIIIYVYALSTVLIHAIDFGGQLMSIVHIIGGGIYF